MHKKSILALVALLLVAAVLLMGLPVMTGQIVESRMQRTVTETATPSPALDGDAEQVNVYKLQTTCLRVDEYF